MNNFIELKDDRLNYTSAVFDQFISKMEKIFISKFSFEGDEKFDSNAQKLLLRTIFRYGKAGVFKNKGEPVIVRVYPNTAYSKTYEYLDANGLITSAFGYPSFLERPGDLFANYDKKLLFLNNKNCAFFQPLGEFYVNSIESLFDKLVPFSKEISRLFYNAHLQNFLTIPKVFMANDVASQRRLDNLFSFDSLTLPYTGADGLAEKDNKFALAMELDKTLKIVKFDSDIDKQFGAIEKYLTLVLKLFGFKYNQTFKKERMLVDEVNQDVDDYKLQEFFTHENLLHFANNYKNVFGKELKIVNNFEGEEEENGDNNNSNDNNNGDKSMHDEVKND